MNVDQIHIEFCKASIAACKQAIHEIHKLEPWSVESIRGGFIETMCRYEIIKWEKALAKYENTDNDYTVGGDLSDLKIKIINPDKC